MATSKVQVTEGSGKNISSYSFTEDSVTKEAQRVALNNSSGTEIGTASNPIRTDPTASTTQPVSATDLDIRNLTATDVVTANLSATDNAVLDTIDAVLDTINAKLVTGTVIGDVNLGATDNAVLDDIAAKLATIDADTSTLAAGVSTEYQVDVVGALPAGTNAIGKLAANSGVDIGDVDVTSAVPGTGATNLGKAEDGGHTSGDVGVMALGVRNDTPNAALAGTDLDYIPTSHSKTGAVHVMPAEEDFAVLGSNKVNKTFNLTGAQTDAIIWSPVAGKRWYITDIHYVVSAAATVTFEDDLAAGDAVVGIGGAYAANGGLSRPFKTPIFSGEDAADLILTTSAGNIQGIISGYEI